MQKEINLKIKYENSEDGETLVSTEYDIDNIKNLSMALLSDESLRELTLLTSAYIIAMSNEPESILESISEMANSIIKECEQETLTT